MRTCRVVLLLLLLGGAAWSSGEFTPVRDPPTVIEIRIANAPITPVTERFLARGLHHAERERAACVLLVLDTPGGLVESTRAIVKAILASEVPVVVYVAPSGARAASAGLFIALAAHVASMAPGTNIGAAHPVPVGEPPAVRPSPDGGSRPDPAPAGRSVEERKAVEDLAAWARALAELRGRNPESAERAVRNSVSLSASEAMRDRLVDHVAPDPDALLASIEGRQVRLSSGTVRLRTAGAPRVAFEMWWGERLLSVVSNPTVAFLLLVLGFYAVLFELYTPGLGVSGVVGAILIVLAFFGLAVLPVNQVGVALVAVALVLFAAEPFIVSYGLLTIGGVVCLALGSLMLVDSPADFQRGAVDVIVPVMVATGAVGLILGGRVLRAHRGTPPRDAEGLVGQLALATEDFVLRAEQHTGLVRIRGELWKAESTQPVRHGETVRVHDRQGLVLQVEHAG